MHMIGALGSYRGHVARRVSRSQIQSQLRQAEARQKQAVNKFNREVRAHNARVRVRQQQAVNRYNREVRAHNAQVRAHRDRLRRELQRLSRTPARVTVQYTVYHQSVMMLHESFRRLETVAEAASWNGDDELFEMSEAEAANSVAVLNALNTQAPLVTPGEREIAELQATTIGDELTQIDAEFDQRWRGALFALHPSNPDAGRHFCASSREMLDSMLKQAAPDHQVLLADPGAPKTERGSPTRRARVVYCLRRRGQYDESLAGFINDDIDNILTLFQEFNTGTHGSAGRFDLAQLRAIKLRVEAAIRFVAHIVL